MNSTGKMVLAVALTALVVGSGTYFITNNKANTNKSALIGTFVGNPNAGNVNENELSPPVPGVVPVSDCQDANLTAGLSNGSGAAGTYYYTLTVTNKGNLGCSIAGSPKLVALSSSGTILGQATATTPSSAKFIIATNQSVYSNIGFPNSSNFSPAACKPMKTLMIYSGKDTTGITIPDIDQLNSDYTSKFCQSFNVSIFSTAAQ